MWRQRPKGRGGCDGVLLSSHTYLAASHRIAFELKQHEERGMRVHTRTAAVDASEGVGCPRVVGRCAPLVSPLSILLGARVTVGRADSRERIDIDTASILFL